MMRLTLKKGWDSQHWAKPDSDEEFNPIFAGRDNEVNRLAGILNKGYLGAIFICGRYGVGKTAVVDRAISITHAKPLEIRINYLTLEMPKDGKLSEEELVYETIRQMVRALYAAVSSKGYLAITKLSQAIKFTKYVRTEQFDKAEEFRLNIQSEKIAPKEIISVGSGLIAGLSSYFSPHLSQLLSHYGLQMPVEPLQNVASLLSAFTSWFFTGKIMDYSVSKLKKKQSSAIQEIDGLSIHEMQSEFHKAVSEIKIGESKKIMFVFEELDKYDEGDNLTEVGPRILLDVLKSLKLLFHNSQASFVFLVGYKTYHLLTSGKYATIPTENIYIAKATPKELYAYLKNILEEDAIDEELRKHFALMINDSQGNFYQLIQLIRYQRRFSSLVEKGAEREVIVTTTLSLERDFKASVLLAMFPYIDSYDGDDRDASYEAMSEIVKHYDASLIDSNPAFAVNDLTVFQREMILAYLKQIFSVGQKIVSATAIPNYSNAEKTVIGSVNWGHLREALSANNYSLLYNNQIGPSLPEEKQFVEDYNQLLRFIRHVLSKQNFKVKIESVDQGIKELGVRIGFSYPQPVQDFTSLVETTFNAISTTPLAARADNWYANLKDNSLPAMERVTSHLEESFYYEASYSKVEGNVSIDEESPITFTLSERPHRPSVEFASLVRLVKKPRYFSREFRFAIEPEGILNVIFGVKHWSNNPVEQEFFMVRFDNREHGHHAILHKPQGQEAWVEKITTADHHVLPDDQHFKLKYSKEGIFVTYPSGEKLDWKVGSVMWFAIGNEIKQAKVQFAPIYTKKS